MTQKGLLYVCETALTIEEDITTMELYTSKGFYIVDAIDCKHYMDGENKDVFVIFEESFLHFISVEEIKRIIINTKQA